MTDDWFDLPKIVRDPDIMFGKPTFEGTRMPVASILACLADGYDNTAILQDFPELTHAHIRAACAYAEQHIPGAILNETDEKL